VGAWIETFVKARAFDWWPVAPRVGACIFQSKPASDSVSNLPLITVKPATRNNYLWSVIEYLGYEP
jgi:hypothetical protein